MNRVRVDSAMKTENQKTGTEADKTLQQLGPEVDGYDRAVHLNLIQSVIGRFGAITLTMKSLATTVAAGLGGVAVSQGQSHLFSIAIIAIAFFGICDSYYSKRSSLHWKLFNRVAKGTRQTRNYNIYVNRHKNLKRFGVALIQILEGLLENPILVFYYGGLIAVIVYARRFM